MATAAQTSANAANSLHSTGPRTEAGKAASSRNALKHGLTAEAVVLSYESEEEFLQFWIQLEDYYRPVHPVEKEMIRSLAETQWRLRRCARLEAEALEAGDFKMLNTVSVHNARLQRINTAALKEIALVFNHREAVRDQNLRDAVLIRMADKRAGTNNLEKIGFDFTTAQIDQAVTRFQALYQSKNVLSMPQNPAAHLYQQ